MRKVSQELSSPYKFYKAGESGSAEYLTDCVRVRVRVDECCLFCKFTRTVTAAERTEKLFGSGEII